MNWRENWNRSKEVLGAHFRHGLQELGSIFYGPGTAAQSPEYGMIGTKLPSEIARGMGQGRDAGSVPGAARTFDLDAYLESNRYRGDAGREPDRNLERE